MLTAAGAIVTIEDVSALMIREVHTSKGVLMFKSIPDLVDDVVTRSLNRGTPLSLKYPADWWIRCPSCRQWTPEGCYQCFNHDCQKVVARLASAPAMADTDAQREVELVARVREDFAPHGGDNFVPAVELVSHVHYKSAAGAVLKNARKADERA